MRGCMRGGCHSLSWQVASSASDHQLFRSGWHSDRNRDVFTVCPAFRCERKLDTTTPRSVGRGARVLSLEEMRSYMEKNYMRSESPQQLHLFDAYLDDLPAQLYPLMQ